MVVATPSRTPTRVTEVTHEASPSPPREPRPLAETSEELTRPAKATRHDDDPKTAKASTSRLDGVGVGRKARVQRRVERLTAAPASLTP